MKNNNIYDLIIVGGGIIGLATACEAINHNTNLKILILEKEQSSLFHGSGRNSGVIHSGIYYEPGTLRAKMCVEGAQKLRQYVDEHSLWNDPCGKILLPTSDASLENLEPLLERANQNGVNAYRVNSREILSLEPLANTKYNDGIFIPVTRVVDPKEVVKHITKKIIAKGVEVKYQQEVIKIDSLNGKVTSQDCNYSADKIINAAGLFADSVAHISGLKFKYQFQPFKGKYWKCSVPGLKMSRLLYPIPDFDLPFLGVHTAHNKKGEVFFGPSSTPSIGRENYNGLNNLKFLEAGSLSAGLIKKFLFNTNGLRNLAFREIMLLTKIGVYREVSKLLTSIKKDDLIISPNKVGIRSQIFDPKQDKLVNDFVVIKQDRAIHVLNAISPAFSASFAFGSFLVNKL